MTEFSFTTQDALPPELASARILVVDDTPANLIVLDELLAEAGYTAVETESSSPAAVKRWLANPYDLLLLDIRMPELDGHAVMALLKKHLPADEYLPCIVLTAQTDRETRDAALAAGAVDFITKPFDFDETLKRIRNALNARLLHRKAQEKAKALDQTLGAQRAILQERERDLAYLAAHDSVTGLLNRHALRERLTAMLPECNALTCVLLEITDADQLLLQEGVESVDRFLRTAASRLSLAVANHFGVCGVWGGQTFLCALPLGAEAAAPMLNRLAQQVFAPISDGALDTLLHGRGGYASATANAPGELDHAALDHAIHSAGFALASAHKHGNSLLPFEPVMAEKFWRRHQVERALTAAVANDPAQFHLVFQPKIDLAGEALVGCEALLRWQHPELGWVSPAEFIPIAEENGLIEDLGLIVIDHAAAFIARVLRDTGRGLPVAVNCLRASV